MRTSLLTILSCLHVAPSLLSVSHQHVAPSLMLMMLAQTQPAAAFSSTASNSDTIITRSYTIHGNNIIDSNSCILDEVRPATLDPSAEKDDETTRRSFVAPGRAENKRLDIRQTSFGCGALGATVWPSAIALAALLAGDENNLMEGKRVMEIGSGCGLPSLVAKEICGAQEVLATDYWGKGDEDNDIDGGETSYDETGGERELPGNLFGANLAYNIKSDSDANTSVRHLDWHDEPGILEIAQDFRPQVIIGSDLVYYPADLTPLLRTLQILIEAGGSANANTEALLISPLRPAYSARKALPEFRRRLMEDGELDGLCEVTMDELEMRGMGMHGDEETHKFLRIRMQSQRSSLGP